MRSMHLLVVAQSLFAIGVGLGFALAPEILPAQWPEFAPFATLRFLGMGCGGLGLVLWYLAVRPAAGRRRLATGLAIGDAALAVLIVVQPPEVRSALWSTVTFPLAVMLALGFAAIAIFGTARDGTRRESRLGRVAAALVPVPFVAQAALATCLGYGITLWPALAMSAPASQASLASIQILGGVWAALGLGFLGLGDFAEPAERRLLAQGLLFAHAASTIMVFGQQTQILLNLLGVLLVAVHLAFTLGFAAVLRSPLSEAASLRKTGGTLRLGLRLWATHLAAGAAAAATLLGFLVLARSRPDLPSVWQWPAGLALGLPLAGFLGLLLTSGWRRRLELADHALAGWLSIGPPRDTVRGRGRVDALARSVEALATHEGEIEALRRGWLKRLGEAAAQEERNRLARDLHDSIKQQLFGIQAQAATAQERWEMDPAGARSAVAAIRNGSREAMLEMEALLDQLQPRALTLPGLVEALRLQCEALRLRTGAVVALELGELPAARLDARAPQALFRIAQEALGNAARHGRCRHVSVGLGRDSENLVLRIEDDGQGFSEGDRGGGMGLRNMHERAAELGGALALDSAPGRGTRIRAELPLSPERAAGPPVAGRPGQVWIPWLAAALLFIGLALLSTGSAQSISVGLGVGVILLFALAAGTLLDLRRPDLSRPVSAELAALGRTARRNRVYCYLAVAWLAPWNPPGSGIAEVPPRPLWLSVCLLTAALAGLELAKLYREAGSVAPGERGRAFDFWLSTRIAPMDHWPSVLCLAAVALVALMIPMVIFVCVSANPLVGVPAVLAAVYASWLAIDVTAPGRS